MPQLQQEDLDQARALKGSVFDDWYSALRRFGASDPMGGMGANPIGGMGVGVIRSLGTPEEIEAQSMLKTLFPKVFRALERDPRAEYRIRYNPELAKGLKGLTTAELDPATKRPIGPVDIQFQSQGLNKAGPETFAHEPLHGFYYASGKGGVAPRGQQILEGLSAPEDVLAYLKAHPKGGPGHGAVARLADVMAYKSGLAPTPYSSIPFPNAGGMKVAPPIGY